MKSSAPLFPLLALGLASLLGACSGQTAAPARPTPQVEVITAHAETLPMTRELVGRLAPTKIAQVRARVPGIIMQRVYEEGSDVHQGDVLFRIDPAQLKAAKQVQQAALAAAQATAHNAAKTAARYKELAKRGVIAKQDLDNATAQAASTAAAAKQAAAALAKARLDLSYATVNAPISGRAGRALVTKGALVGDGSATELTTIKQIDPIYVDFSEPIGVVQSLRQQQARGALQMTQPDTMPVSVKLSDGSQYAHAGTLDFSDMAVDPQTGSVSLRARIPNPERRLLPGMYVHVLLTVGQMQHVYAIPQKAVLRDAGGAYVMLVDDSGKVIHRPVTAQGMRAGDWIITDGLADGDRVIISGLQKVRPGASVQAKPYQPGIAGRSATAASATSVSAATAGSARPAAAASSH